MEDVEHVYCPVCGEYIPQYVVGNSYVVVHKDIPHSDSDLEALDYGIQ